MKNLHDSMIKFKVSDNVTMQKENACLYFYPKDVSGIMDMTSSSKYKEALEEAADDEVIAKTFIIFYSNVGINPIFVAEDVNTVKSYMKHGQSLK